MDHSVNVSGRRKFIGNLAAFGAVASAGMGAVMSSCTRKPAYTAPVFPDKAPGGPVLKAGVVGCGWRGTGAALNFLNAGPNLEVTVLGDLFEHRLESCRKSIRDHHGAEIPDENCFSGFDCYKRVIDSDIDVVLLCEPPYFRPVSFEYAIKARRHAFIEKPVGVDPVGVRSVMAAGRMAESAGLVVVAGTHYRHMRDRVQALEMVRNGAIGDIISVNCYFNMGKLWHVNRQEGWSDMEAMIRDWVNWRWLSGDHIVEQHIHELDTVGWFLGKHPVKALGFGGRHRRPTGDQNDFFSVDFVYDDGRHMHSMCRQIDGCANKVDTYFFGTKGYTNGMNAVWDYNGNLLWEYQYPLDDEGRPTNMLKVSPHDQEIINFVTAIRTNNYVNDTQNVSQANIVAMMGRESAYTGREVGYSEIMDSNMKLGPDRLEFGPYDIPHSPPVPGTSPA
ncbi:MAG: gfo/Idh/MocA family oxidoreductase [Marinilabiliales bacterium]|nr:MAG: gfo/Idh/MocA family oxidoreductase [Marinilabiliales bacterium]